MVVPAGRARETGGLDGPGGDGEPVASFQPEARDKVRKILKSHRGHFINF